MLFAFLTVLAVSRTEPGLGEWVDRHPDTYSPGALVYDLALIGGPSGNISPLWSLQWEVLFSLLLILYVAVVRWVPPPLAVVLSGLACAAGIYVSNPVLTYMSMFAVGSALAYAWGRLARAHDAVEQKIGLAACGLLAPAAVVATVALQLLPMFGLNTANPDLAATNMFVSMLAITAAIVLIGLTSSMRAVFESRIMHWLGAVSFSLYLVHEPVLLAFTYSTRADTVWVLAGLALCFPVAQLFYWFVEKPSHRVAQRVGKRGLGGRAQPHTTAPLVTSPMTPVAELSIRWVDRRGS